MFSALFDSLFSSTTPLDCEAPGVHAGENPSSQSDTPSDIISDPQEAKQHKQELGDKIEKADGATQPKDEEEAAPAEEEEEEEEEVPDQGEQIREACGQTKACKTFLHHLEECGERLAEGKTIVQNETCVEELFHYMHCVDECAAPKIFAALK
ncbi:hypothetical protein JCM10908_005190 [Rhodotorula pacifica]|uniref:cytochrome b-c1 complex subunit 6 family protein n=1 Tax=Rhodotorula pacifica TaxID=1495444 RepID=UPI00316F6363